MGSKSMRAGVSRRAFLGLVAASVAALGACSPAAMLSRADRPLPRTAEVLVWLADQNAGARRAFTERILPELHARRPDLKARVEWKRWERLIDEVAVTAGGAAGPDVFQFGFDDAIRLADSGLAVGLDSPLLAWGAAADFFTASRAAARWNSVTWGIPTASAPTTVFWRVDILEALGIPAVPVTWEETVEVCRKARLVQAGELRREGINPPTADEILMLFMSVSGRAVVEAGRSRLNSPAGRDALRYAMQRWRIARDGPENLRLPPSPVPYLVSGMRVGQFGNMPGAILPFVAGAPDLLQTVMAGPPPMAGGADFKPSTPGLAAPVTQTFTDSVGVSALAKEPDAAFEVIKHITSPDSLLLYNEALFLTPPRRSATGRGYALDYGNARLIEFLDRSGVAAPKVPHGKRFRDAIARQLGPLFAEALEPDEALILIEEEQNRLLEEAGFTGEIISAGGIRAD